MRVKINDFWIEVTLNDVRELLESAKLENVKQEQSPTIIALCEAEIERCTLRWGRSGSVLDTDEGHASDAQAPGQIVSAIGPDLLSPGWSQWGEWMGVRSPGYDTVEEARAWVEAQARAEGWEIQK
jgi:hypothetical protein